MTLCSTCSVSFILSRNLYRASRCQVQQRKHCSGDLPSRSSQCMRRKMQKQRSPVRELSKVWLKGTQWVWETLLVVRGQGMSHRGGGLGTGNSTWKVAKHERASESFAPAWWRPSTPSHSPYGIYETLCALGPAVGMGGGGLASVMRPHTQGTAEPVIPHAQGL